MTSTSLIDICLIMAGGSGSRFKDPLKYMREICGESILKRLIRQLKLVCVNIIIVASDKSLYKISDLCREDFNIDCVETSGHDYVSDLIIMLSSIRARPILISGADVFIRSIDILIDFINKAFSLKDANIINLAVYENDQEKLIGLSIFFDDRGVWRNISYDSDEVFDIDTYEDLRRAENVCR
ncbi:MAG: NTP transferase domain-containing protein [Desulfurococcales archaeon]|nr:NTP transferase domain-containing protein [Desulfurococcales archaeon]